MLLSFANICLLNFISFSSNAYYSTRYINPSIQNHRIFSNLNRGRIVQTANKASIMNGMVIDSVDGLDITKGMPDKSIFKSFYSNNVKKGNEMILDQFIKYQEVSKLFDDGLIFIDDVKDLWISAVGDAEGLDVDEAYEMLCMVMDLPDPEDMQYLDDEFAKLTNNGTMLSFDSVLNWSDIQDMIKEEALTIDEISKIWIDTVGQKDLLMNRIQFGIFNNALDEKIFSNEEVTAVLDLENEEFDETNIDSKSDSNVTDVNDIDLSSINVWDPDFNPISVFEEEVYNDISLFYRKNAQAGGLSFTILRGWKEIDELILEGALSENDLQNLWKEAPKSFKGLIDFDTFVRLNVRMDVVMDENEKKAKVVTKKIESPKIQTNPAKSGDSENYYSSQFLEMTKQGRLLSFDVITKWEEIAELIRDGEVTPLQLKSIFDSLPREPIDASGTVLGITLDSFVLFNTMLDTFLFSASLSDNVPKEKVAAPTALTSADTLPKPKMSELKLGALGDNSPLPISDDDASMGLSPEEMEMMQMLDKADNMLNSGSFGDFDQLIGDVNDPRLSAIREKEMEGREKLTDELSDIVKELLTLGRAQSRCGLDPPEEEVAARLRDLMTAATEKGPKLASRSLDDLRESMNGKWRLLYTNSEMVRFYNGITGLVNVFPSSKFQSVEMEMTSDGYLNEAKYYEDLSTIAGAVRATVYANWELVKEMSFMTNENSIVLRNYCTKVTAGPFEYMAEENWKSLRSMSLNEMVYIDNNIRIMRNSGALRIFFLYERIR